MPELIVRRGAIPSPRSALAADLPHVASTAPPPNFIVVPQQISMWGNDSHGDCVTAEEAFAKACNSPEIFVSDQDVIAWATKHQVLEGANLSQVLQTMVSDGFALGGSIYDDGPHLTVDWTNASILQSAIAKGPVKIGIAADQMETVWQKANGRTGWFATGFHADGNEDHCVSLCGYGTLAWLAQQLHVPVPAGIDGSKPGYVMFTWNSIGVIDVPSLLAITHEAWLRQPTTVIKSDVPNLNMSGEFCLCQPLARLQNHLDLFWAAPDGSVRSAWWDQNANGGRWNAPFDIAPAGSAVAGPVAALSRVPAHVDVFWAAPDGSVRSAWWDQNINAGRWNAPFDIAPPGSAIAAPVVALSRTPLHVDLFWTAPDGSVRSAWWDQNANNANWNAPFEIATPGSAKGSVGALARTTTHIDVFWTAPDGSARSAWWDRNANGGRWNSPFEIAPPASIQIA